ncbi:MAG TPA: MazG family protein, partial [Acidimicrobiales bacterium]|nr:MazG family protein [Acidimicrobiales bacterium]
RPRLARNRHRSLEPDHLTCCFVPDLAAAPGAELASLIELVRVLRERCPWDRVQTHQSLVRHLVEEAYEVIESIEELGAPASEAAPAVDADRGVHLEEELGDLLVQVLFHSRLAAEEGMFDLAGVARTCTEKLVRRHPHVFGDVTGVTTAGAVEGRWEQIKKQEKGRSSLTEGIPSSLPALMLAAKLERKLGSVGLGWPATGTAASTLPALLEAAVAGDEEALGDLLLALARISAHRRGDPEEALRRAAGTLRRRFVLAEQLAEAAGSDLADAGDEARRDAWQGARPG